MLYKRCFSNPITYMPVILLDILMNYKNSSRTTSLKFPCALNQTPTPTTAHLFPQLAARKAFGITRQLVTNSCRHVTYPSTWAQSACLRLGAVVVVSLRSRLPLCRATVSLEVKGVIYCLVVVEGVGWGVRICRIIILIPSAARARVSWR